MHSALLEGRHVRRFASGEADFAYIAEYGPDDDPRHLNWAATARGGRPMKNVYHPERGQHVIIAIDVGRYMGVRLPDGTLRLDETVRAAAALAQAALACGDAVGLLAFASDVMLRLPPGLGAAQWRRIVDGLSSLTPQPQQGGYEALYAGLTGRLHRRGFLIVFSELEGMMADTDLRRYLGILQRRHPTLFTSLVDTVAEREVQKLPQSAREAAEVASAMWILHDRAARLADLRRQGIAALEAPPGDSRCWQCGNTCAGARAFCSDGNPRRMSRRSARESIRSARGLHWRWRLLGLSPAPAAEPAEVADPPHGAQPGHGELQPVPATQQA